jgi:hypothetical protein
VNSVSGGRHAYSHKIATCRRQLLCLQKLFRDTLQIITMNNQGLVFHNNVTVQCYNGSTCITAHFTFSVSQTMPSELCRKLEIGLHWEFLMFTTIFMKAEFTTWTLDVKEHGKYFQIAANKSREIHCAAATWNITTATTCQNSKI